MIRPLGFFLGIGKILASSFAWIAKSVKQASSNPAATSGFVDKATLSSQADETFWRPCTNWKTLRLYMYAKEKIDYRRKFETFDNEVDRIAKIIGAPEPHKITQIDVLDIPANQALTQMSGIIRVTSDILVGESCRGRRYLYLVPKDKSHPADYLTAYEATLDYHYDWPEDQNLLLVVKDRVGNRVIEDCSFQKDPDGYISFTDGFDEHGNDRIFKWHRRLLRTPEEVQRLF